MLINFLTIVACQKINKYKCKFTEGKSKIFPIFDV